MRESPMLECIEKRELIVLDGLGARLRGTYHPPADRPSDAGASRQRIGRIGVVFVNSLSLPRAASGDSAVYWADAIAEQGYPAFRMDLPGLGDSEGEASTDLLDSINSGGFASVATAAVTELVKRFGLSGMVICGHCAGSVSALYAATTSAECKGLILLDPYFHLPRATRPRVRQELSSWARRSSIGGFLSDSYDRARNLRLSLRGNAPPANANVQLLARWKQIATAGLPILVLKAPGIKAQGARPRVGEFDYMAHILRLAGRNRRVSLEFLSCADHSFANREGRQAVEGHITDWLLTHFPLADFKLRRRDEAGLRAGKDQTDLRRPQAAPVDLGCALKGS